jgi:hypothetical protein
MSVGTTFKLGFDGMSVSRGLAGISKKVGSFSREIGIGAARQVGARMTDLMGRIVMAIPDALSETADWAGNMVDMSTQTGVSIEKLVVLEEALKLSGAAAKDTSMIISKLSKNLYDASTEGGAAKDALNKLGFFADEFVDVPIDRAFEMIGKRVAELGPDFKGLEGIMSDLFGAKMGYKFIRFFRDFEGGMSDAENNVGQLAGAISKSAGSIDDAGDALSRFENVKRSLASIVLEEALRFGGGSDGINAMFDKFDPEKMRPKIQEMFSTIARSVEVLMGGSKEGIFGDMFKNIGKDIGEGFKDALNLKPLIPIFGKGLFGGDAKTSQAFDPENKRHTALLERIERNVGTAKFA